jgi:hypothetical protein
LDSLKNYFSGYQFVYAAFSWNQMPGSFEYMDSMYNFSGVPTSYYDGGQGIMIGGYLGTPEYRNRIEAAGTRPTHDLYLKVSVDYISQTQLNIHYEVASRENQAPLVATQPTSDCVIYPTGLGSAFVTRANEPDGDQIYYRWAFGDGDSSTWIGPYNSGDTCMVNHSYAAKGSYNVKVLTKDLWLTGTVWSSPLVVLYGCQCGDANSDGSVDISDAVFLIAHIFSGGGTPGPCACDGMGKARGDANGDSAVDISDVVFLIARIFSGGAPPHCP